MRNMKNGVYHQDIFRDEEGKKRETMVTENGKSVSLTATRPGMTQNLGDLFSNAKVTPKKK